jgi:corrinoid protein of di/trimethylamine methyltransferase
MMSDLYERMSEAVVSGNVKEVTRLTRQALDRGLNPGEILDHGLLPGMDTVGQEFKAGAMFIPEVLASAKTMSAAMEILRPLLTASGAAGAGTVVIGTVQGDLHSIGKNLVAMMLEGAGFTVVDLGIDVQPQAFIVAAREHSPQVLGMSALLTTTLPRMGETIRALEEANLRDQVKVIVGGAPVNHDFARAIGADGYAPNAAAAVDVVKALVRH